MPKSLEVKLTAASRAHLLKHVPPQHQQHVADHVTVHYDPSEEEQLKYEKLHGKQINFHVTHSAHDNKIHAVRVKGIPTKNAHPHITVAAGPDVKHVESNRLLAQHKGTPLQPWLRLTGHYHLADYPDAPIHNHEELLATEQLAATIATTRPIMSEQIKDIIRLARGGATGGRTTFTMTKGDLDRNTGDQRRLQIAKANLTEALRNAPDQAGIAKVNQLTESVMLDKQTLDEALLEASLVFNQDNPEHQRAIGNIAKRIKDHYLKVAKGSEKGHLGAQHADKLHDVVHHLAAGGKISPADQQHPLFTGGHWSAYYSAHAPHAQSIIDDEVNKVRQAAKAKKAEKPPEAKTEDKGNTSVGTLTKDTHADENPPSTPATIANKAWNTEPVPVKQAQGKIAGKPVKPPKGYPTFEERLAAFHEANQTVGNLNPGFYTDKLKTRPDNAAYPTKPGPRSKVANTTAGEPRPAHIRGGVPGDPIGETTIDEAGIQRLKRTGEVAKGFDPTFPMSTGAGTKLVQGAFQPGSAQAGFKVAATRERSADKRGKLGQKGTGEVMANITNRAKLNQA